jgi:CRP-like cAMP-binding protein
MLYYFAFQPKPMWLDIISESIVVLVNVFMIVLLFSRERYVSFSDSEKEIYEGIFPSLSAFEFFKLMRRAKWKSHHVGTELTRKGHPVSAVYLIYNGAVSVKAEGEETLTLADGYFVGERSFMNSKVANADVVVKVPTRTLSWNQEELRTLLERNPAMNHSFSSILSKDISKKLYGV